MSARQGKSLSFSMDGLIKGLIDVALGGHGADQDDNDREQQQQRSERSSWADVVSGEDHDQEEDHPRPHQHQHQHQQWSNPPHKVTFLHFHSQPPKNVILFHNVIIAATVARGYSQLQQASSSGQCHSLLLYIQDSSQYIYLPPKLNYSCNRSCSIVHEQSRPQYEESQSERFNTSNAPHKLDEDQDGWQTVGKPSRRTHKVPKENWNSYKRPADEQEYSNEAEFGASVEPSGDELADLARACDKLWDLDLNRLIPGKDYEIDCGEGKKAYQKEDVAQGSLFTWVSDDVFRRPTFARFLSLLDNYNPHQGCKEVVTSEEKQEQASFIEEISRTAPIKYLHKYLASKGIASGSYQDFKRMITSLWFDLYGRGGTSGSSSAFEHVFVGEIKQSSEVSGFHNWLQFYLEEEKGRVDYQGYIFPRRRGQFPDSETQLLTIQFEWNGVLKSVSSTLVGVSPEFEIALYTLCFYLGGEDNHIQIGPYEVNIKCYRFGDRIGSVFPIADS